MGDRGSLPPASNPSPERVASGAIWRELADCIRRLGDIVLDPRAPATAHHRAEGLRYLTRFLAAGITVCVAHDDADTPEFGRMVENRMSWGMDNPDCLYVYSRIRGDATYRLLGNRGTACHIEFQVNTGHFGDGNFTGWKAIAAMSGDELVTAADGGFELGLGGKPQGDNWIPLAPDASFILVRQYFNDWERERPAALEIERIGATLPPPRYPPERLASQLDLLMTWLDAGARCWADLGAGIASAEPGPITPFLPPDDAAGLKGQAYGMGSYRCAPEEAVVLEVTPPPCRLWSLSLADWYWQSMEFAARQTSINGSQAAIDDDGAVRAVIAHVDPEVPNWLDACGFERGTVAVRYLLPESVPTVAYRTVPLAALREHLPSGTPRVTAAERSEQLARRARAVARRYRR